MRARTLVNICLAILPIAFLAFVGIMGRTQIIPDPNPYYDPKLNKDFLAFQRPILETQKLYIQTDASFTARLLQVADVWIETDHYNDLNKIGPISAVDIGDFGVKYEIETSRRFVLQKLSTESSRLMNEGENDLVAEMSLKMLQLSKVCQYTSATSMQNSSLMQGVAFDNLNHIREDLSDEKVVEIRSYLANYEPVSDAKLKMLHRMESYSWIPTLADGFEQSPRGTLENLLSADYSAAANSNDEPKKWLALSMIRLALQSEQQTVQAHHDAMTAYLTDQQ